MNAFKVTLTVLLGSLLLTACSEELSSKAKQAASQISDEAKKAATQKIDEVKNQTIEQIKQVGKEPTSPKASEEREKSATADKVKSDSKQ